MGAMRSSVPALIATALFTSAPGAASAQSMNVPLIVHRVTTEVCGPFMQSDDMAAALEAAMAQGYRPVDFDPGDPPPRVVLDGSARHIGTLTLGLSRRGLCAIDMAEAGVAQIVEAADEPLAALGLALAFDGGEHRPGAAVWTGEGRLATAGPGLATPGHALTFSWTRSPAR